jgi:poly(A)-specific ribonuclease
MQPGAAWVNVGNPDGPLNGYQRRLVHQLIREEFPALKCIARNDNAFMQVRVLDHEKEAQVGNFKVQARFSRVFLTSRSFMLRSLLNTTIRSPSKRVCILPRWSNILFS